MKKPAKKPAKMANRGAAKAPAANMTWLMEFRPDKTGRPVRPKMVWGKNDGR